MKTLKYYILPLCGVALASCTDLNVEPATISQDESPEVKTVLTAVIGPGTRTVLGEKNEKGQYPVSWQATDRICVNGAEASGVELSEGSMKASFSFGEELTAPYNAVYPADAYKADDGTAAQEGEDAVSGSTGKVTVTIPSSQTWNLGTFDSGSAVMYARAESKTELVFHHLMAYLKLSFSTESDPDPIKTIVLKSRGSKPMSGDFIIDFASSSPALAYASEAAATTVTVDCGEAGAALGTEVIVAVPAQTYASGIEITTTDTNGDKTVHILKQSFQAVAGTVYPMPIAFELYPGSRQKPVKVGNLLWAPVYCGYSAEHPNGLLYQWGRAKGQAYFPTSETNNEIIAAAPIDVPQEDLFYALKNGSTDNDWYGGTPLSDWPISGSDVGYSEAVIDNPCPTGWRIPTVDEFNTLNIDKDHFTESSGGWPSVSKDSDEVKVGFTHNDSGLFFAAAGARMYYGRSGYRGTGSDAYARVWSSVGDATTGMAKGLQLRRKSAPTIMDIRKSFGCSVRCVKNVE